MSTASADPREDHRIFIYRVNADDEIVFVNSEWCAFAQENGAHTLNQESVFRRSLWDFVSNEETRHLFEVIVRKVRTDGTAKRVCYRCDAPALRRFMVLEVSAAENGEVEFRSRILREEPRDSVRLMELDVERSDELLGMCGWCKQIRLPDDRWVEVEAAVEELRLFDASILPKLSHGICPPCLEAFDYDLEES